MKKKANKQQRQGNTITRTQALLEAISQQSRLGPETHAFNPDWQELWTPEKAEFEMMGFKYSGPGWYLEKHGTVLVLPSYDPERFHFLVYDGRNPCDCFNQIVNAPVRLDKR